MATVRAEVFTETYLHRGKFYYSRKIQVERSRYSYTGDESNLLDANRLLESEIITIEEKDIRSDYSLLYLWKQNRCLTRDEMKQMLDYTMRDKKQ